MAGVNQDIRTPEECSKAGGWRTEVGRDQAEACVIQATDSGEERVDDNECESFCAARLGAAVGADTKGACSSGIVGSCEGLHVRGHHAVSTCVE